MIDNIHSRMAWIVLIVIDPVGLVLRMEGRVDGPFQLVYGSVPTPYCMIVDERDNSIAAIGPINVPLDCNKL